VHIRMATKVFYLWVSRFNYDFISIKMMFAYDLHVIAQSGY
jgi:hypothetical protein